MPYITASPTKRWFYPTQEEVEEIMGPVNRFCFHYGQLTFEPTRAITFKSLETLSKLCKTDKINLRPESPATRYSSYTYDSGSPSYVEVICPEEDSD